MWRISKRHRPSQFRPSRWCRSSRPPEAQRCSRMSASGSAGHVEAGAHRSRALAPRQEDRRRIVDDRALKRRDAGLVRVIARRVLGSRRARRRRRAAESPAVERATRVPEQIRPNQRRPAERRRPATHRSRLPSAVAEPRRAAPSSSSRSTPTACSCRWTTSARRSCEDRRTAT